MTVSHKETTAARKLLALQRDDGSFGPFHTLSKDGGSPVTTEQALARLERLGFTREDACIARALRYLDDCLCGKRAIPDRRERARDWDVFVELMLAARVRRFTDGSDRAERVARRWAGVVTAAFEGGAYDFERYRAAYEDTFHIRLDGSRQRDFVNFYPVSLLADKLADDTARRAIDYVMSKEDGIYYVYPTCLSKLPAMWSSLDASRYLAAIELAARYRAARGRLGFVARWIEDNRMENGAWDMGAKARDGVCFPLSENWRSAETRVKDCTERLSALMRALNDGDGATERQAERRGG